MNQTNWERKPQQQDRWARAVLLTVLLLLLAYGLIALNRMIESCRC